MRNTIQDLKKQFNKHIEKLNIIQLKKIIQLGKHRESLKSGTNHTEDRILGLKNKTIQQTTKEHKY